MQSPEKGTTKETAERMMLPCLIRGKNNWGTALELLPRPGEGQDGAENAAAKAKELPMIDRLYNFVVKTLAVLVVTLGCITFPGLF